MGRGKALSTPRLSHPPPQLQARHPTPCAPRVAAASDPALGGWGMLPAPPGRSGAGQGLASGATAWRGTSGAGSRRAAPPGASTGRVDAATRPWTLPPGTSSCLPSLPAPLGPGAGVEGVKRRTSPGAGGTGEGRLSPWDAALRSHGSVLGQGRAPAKLAGATPGVAKGTPRVPRLQHPPAEPGPGASQLPAAAAGT